MSKKKFEWFDFSDYAAESLHRSPQEIADAFFSEVCKTGFAAGIKPNEIAKNMKISISNFYYQAKRIGLKFPKKKLDKKKKKLYVDSGEKNK